jgi:hypothetical protein
MMDKQAYTHAHTCTRPRARAHARMRTHTQICNIYCFSLQQWSPNAFQCQVTRSLSVLFFAKHGRLTSTLPFMRWWRSRKCSPVAEFRRTLIFSRPLIGAFEKQGSMFSRRKKGYDRTVQRVELQYRLVCYAAEHRVAVEHNFCILTTCSQC